MIKVEAMIRPQQLETVKAALDEIGVTGMTVCEVKGAGKQRGVTQTYRGSQYTINLLPKIKLEIVCSDEQAKEVANAIMEAARTGEVGDGKIFLIPVADAIRIRTGDQGEIALE